MLRIKNEARWIERVVHSILPLCERVFVLDDHSSDGTPEICEGIARCTVFRSPYEGLDETRDKNFLLWQLFNAVPKQDRHFTYGNPLCPYWAVAIDGDEVLEPGGPDLLRVEVHKVVHSLSLPILYLWDTPERYRVDGVYGSFRRPSVFRLMNNSFTFKATPWGNGANFHCSSVPQELLHGANRSKARLLHLGYMDRVDRLRKFAWYSEIDPGNAVEDCYRHMVQGDVAEVPANAKLKWAGPLRTRSV
jgi:glycosyltransferase involved in cell wall biosynthesis